jgi:hypothetical protein
MDTTPTFGLQQEVLTHVISDMGQALGVRDGESREQWFARAQRSAQTILAFQPADAVEAMIASHCVMFHEMIVDTVQTMPHGATEATCRATRNSIVAMDRAFSNNLVRLRQHRAGRVAAAAEPPAAEAFAETEIADRMRRHQPDAPAEAAAPEPADVSADGVHGHQPNARTEAALPEPADVARPVPVPGLDQAAAVPMAGLNRQARRAILRQNGKHHGPGAPGSARAPRFGVTQADDGPGTGEARQRAAVRG